MGFRKYSSLAKIISFLFSFCLNLWTAQSFAEVILKDLQGHDCPFSAMQGKWVFLNYWAQWCEACIEEIPIFNTLHQQHKNLALFAVNFDALPLSKQRHLIKELGIQYPNLTHDPAKELGLPNIQVLPVTFVFNPKGQWVDTLYGGQSIEALQKILQ